MEIDPYNISVCHFATLVPYRIKCIAGEGKYFLPLLWRFNHADPVVEKSVHNPLED